MPCHTHQRRRQTRRTYPRAIYTQTEVSLQPVAMVNESTREQTPDTVEEEEVDDDEPDEW